MSCQFKSECPSYSGWCEGPKQDFSGCVQFIISAYNRLKNEHPKVMYVCDGRACEKCFSAGRETDCNFTQNVRHAKNFRLCGDAFVEVRD